MIEVELYGLKLFGAGILTLNCVTKVVGECNVFVVVRNVRH